MVGTTLIMLLEISFLVPCSQAGTFFAPRVDYPTAARPTAIVAGDLNLNDTEDLILACGQADSVAIYLGNGDGTYQPRNTYPTGDGPGDVALADLNNDLKLDLITVESNAFTFSVRLGNGDGTFGDRIIRSGSFTQPINVVVGYFDSGKNLDIAVAHALPHGFSVYLGNGDGTFGNPFMYGTSGAPGAGLTLGDINNDGYQDIVAGAGARVVVYRGNGDGTFSFLSHFFPSPGVGLSIGTGDFNSDGNVDLVAGLSISAISIWLGLGDGAFGPQVTYPTGSGNVFQTTVVDLNGDGFLDVAVANASHLAIFSGWGDGTFAARADFNALTNALALVARDLDSMGLPDIAVGDYTGNAVSIFLNRTLVTDVAPHDSQVALEQSEPNPTKSTAVIRFYLQHADAVSLCLYDVSGRLVSTLVEGPLTAGWHVTSWNGKTNSGARSPAGVYVYELRTKERRFTKRLTLLNP